MEEWASRGTYWMEVEITAEMIERAGEKYGRRSSVYMHHVIRSIVPQMPSKKAVRTAAKCGEIWVNGKAELSAGSTMKAPAPGTVLRMRLGTSCESCPDDLEERLLRWNTQSPRPQQQMRVLHSVPEEGWAIVNKPAGLHSMPNAETKAKASLTLQDYLPVLVPPPQNGIWTRLPKAQHRLDFRVAGPLVVATCFESQKEIRRAFKERTISKEYAAVAVGKVGSAGEEFTVDSPLEGREAVTDVVVKEVVDCPHFGSLSYLQLFPRTGRYHQLRLHCAKVLGAPLVNEDESIWKIAEAPWLKKYGSPLPAPMKRNRGLYLQAVEVTVPPMECVSVGATVRVDADERFQHILRQSQGAFDKGWRGSEGDGDNHNMYWDAEEGPSQPA